MAVELVPIEVCRVEAGLETLLAPDAGEWRSTEEVAVPIDSTPLDRQPSAYVQAAWRDRPRGGIGEVRVRAAAGAGGLADWAALRPSRRISDVNVYPDACAVIFPADGREAEFGTMGGPKHPVQGWHWRAGTDVPFVVTATGAGRWCWRARSVPTGFPSRRASPCRWPLPCGRAQLANALV